MSPALVLKFVMVSGIKKHVVTVIASMTIVLALPFLAVGAMGKEVLLFLSIAPSA